MLAQAKASDKFACIRHSAGEKHPADPSSHCADYATLGVLSLFGSRGVKGSPALGSVPPPRLSRHAALSRPEVGPAL